MKKQILLVGAALLAITSVGQQVSAKTLEEILKEKGVITEADYKEVTKVKPIEYKLGKGFTFTSQDEKFQLAIGGRLQARYTFFDRDQERVPGSADASQWQVRRMKVWLSGYAYSKDLTYLLQLETTATNVNPSSGSGSTGAKFIDHAYLNYKFIPEAQILVGQTKVPFGRQWLTSSGALSFVDRSPVSDAFRPGYDIGVKLHGKIADGVLNYDIGGYGGKGQGIISGDNNNSLAARIALNPMGDLPLSEADFDNTACPLFSVGVNYFYDTIGRTGTTPANATLATTNLNFTNNAASASAAAGATGWLNNFNLNNRGFAPNEKIETMLFGVDAGLKWMGMYAVAEYLMGQAVGDNTDAHLRAHGYFAQAGYCIIPKTVEAAVRWSWLDPNRDLANDQRSELAGAVSYYVNKHNLKVQADVAKLHNQGSNGNNEMQYRLQAQIIF